MSKIYLLLLLFISNTVTAQSGKISGKIINASSGQPLAGATVALVVSSRTTTTDQSGNFSFSKLSAGVYAVQCSYSGHVDKVVTEIIVRNNETAVISISLDQKVSDGVIVTATRTRAAGESIASLLVAQRNSASVSDGISAESIRKTPDRSTSDVLVRVSGVSIQDSRFAIIRGLNKCWLIYFLSASCIRNGKAKDFYYIAFVTVMVAFPLLAWDEDG